MEAVTKAKTPDINYMTLKEWPTAHEVWADDGFERINQLLDKAVHLVGRKAPNESIKASQVKHQLSLSIAIV